MPAESGTQRILYLIKLFRPDYLICTPSLAEYLADRAPSDIGMSVGDLQIKGIMVAGEPGGGLVAFREKIKELYGARLFDAQIGSLGICNVSCDASEYTGLHQLAPDLQIWPEDLVSIDGEPIEIEHGATGRMLLTSFDQEARPAVKMDMGDVCQVWTEPCPCCGFRGLRYSIMGRTDDMLIVKGVNVYPSALKDIVVSFAPDTTGQFRIILDSQPPRVKPPLRMSIEYAQHVPDEALEHLRRKLKERMHGLLKVSPEIKLVPEGTFPRTELKTKYIQVTPHQG